MTTTIGMLLYPGLTQLDLTGPYEVLSRLPGADVHLVWKTTDLVRSETGLGLAPTTAFADCPAFDVLFVPGGPGQLALMTDESVLGFLRNQAKTAKTVCSVCAGSLLLGAAGLLQGYAATSHWAYVDLLPTFGAIPTKGRVVVDRDRITAGGVTAASISACAWWPSSPGRRPPRPSSSASNTIRRRRSNPDTPTSPILR